MPTRTLKIFLCGDVMTGRGIDQILRYPSKPVLYESWVKDARHYIKLAEQENGPIPRGVKGDYLWEPIISEWRKRRPQVRIINLETAITQSDHYWAGKGINYRMHPRNIDALTSAQIDICTLANNHILDWHEEGLRESLTTLESAGIRVAGAGLNREQAMSPAIVNLEDNQRVLVFAMATGTSGVPADWAAGARPGVYRLQELSVRTLARIRDNIACYRQPGDLVIASIHWGGNWGYEIPESHHQFAHALCDDAGVSLVHGHSSHHPMPLEIYKHKLILYGCGDFMNDYEGIGGYEAYRSDLRLMYFLEYDTADHTLRKMALVPLQIRRFQLHHASTEDAHWLAQLLNTKSSFESTHFNLDSENTLLLENSAGTGELNHVIY